MKSILYYLALTTALVMATPDCYDKSVTALRQDYMDVLPQMLFYGKIDWLTI